MKRGPVFTSKEEEHFHLRCLTCLRKVWYKHPIDADLALAEIWAYKKRNLTKYQCPICNFWHLTSKQGWSYKTA